MTTWGVVTNLFGALDTAVKYWASWPQVLAGATLAIGLFAIAVNSTYAGIALLLLILDDIQRYFQGRDSVTGDFIEGWKKFVKLMFEPGDYKDSGWASFFKWIGEKIGELKDATIEAARFVESVTGKKMATAHEMTSAEKEDQKNLLWTQKTLGIEPTVGNGDTRGWKDITGKTTIGKVEITVHAPDAAKAGEAVRDELNSMLESTSEVYK